MWKRKEFCNGATPKCREKNMEKQNEMILTDRVRTPLPGPPLFLHISVLPLRLFTIAPLSGDGGVVGTLPDGMTIALHAHKIDFNCLVYFRFSWTFFTLLRFTFTCNVRFVVPKHTSARSKIYVSLKYLLWQTIPRVKR